MSEKFYIGRFAGSIEESPAFEPYTRVELYVNDDEAYVAESAGGTEGRTLTVTCPWGTQDMANNILAQISGYAYRPYSAENTRLDPAAELGDAVTVGNVYGGVFVRSESYGKSLRSAISAPAEEEIDHEYPYQPAQQRAIKRLSKAMKAEFIVQADRISAVVTQTQQAIDEAVDGLEGSVEAALTVQADQISAKVSKTGGSASSFGWSLTDSAWTLTSGNTEVLKATKDGLSVKGHIEAESGKVGTCIIGADGGLRTEDFRSENDTYRFYEVAELSHGTLSVISKAVNKLSGAATETVFGTVGASYVPGSGLTGVMVIRAGDGNILKLTADSGGWVNIGDAVCGVSVGGRMSIQKGIVISAPATGYTGERTAGARGQVLCSGGDINTECYWDNPFRFELITNFAGSPLAGTVTLGGSYDKYKAYMVVAKPSSAGAMETVTIPSDMLPSSYDWQVADEVNFVRFTASVSGGSVKLSVVGGNGMLVAVYGIG